MMEESSICPYTGLRPFTEEESIYFKGRDEHIDQATRQLEKNKFIMLTGASGDGKSSLVYAGILPNAKAGFLKSQFSNWAVAHFRPERNPLGNLSHALARQLGIANENTVLTELSHGFSALVDMYKASPLFADVRDDGWKTMDETEKSSRKRAAANLIIVADQFEEFFTNPENFHKGSPSQEANLVTNLLLETARIALEEKLPIYVVITMRSDFIGQCASFRGLPEAIGFSQFFVPRLNRSQLQEVIEEPALLSGNKISRRLTERLIHDMVEGTDQLPILQHALNQIWKMADEGKGEMDLVHYAMVGGMQGNDLPEEDARRFSQWFSQLPDKIQACYDQPDLQNVLNTHANKLYISGSGYSNDHAREQINETDARLIIETAFKCLTKIDNSRAVRNRMTLAEITAIIHHPRIDYEKVGKVLNIFREPGNTLLRPFLDEVPALEENTVLDITHESLIRNWDNLDQWAREEYVNYTTFLDFTQQLNRWVDSGKSNAFLLYIGPLTYFENFFDKAKPNAAWIARYLSEEPDQQQLHARADGILFNAREFLRRSASKHQVTRTVMKYGPRKIAAVVGLIVFLAAGAFMVMSYLGRRNPIVLNRLTEQSGALLNNPVLNFADRSLLAVEPLRLKTASVHGLVNQVKDPLEKIKMAHGIATALVFQGRTEPAREIAASIDLTDSLFGIYPVPYHQLKALTGYMTTMSEWSAVLGLAYFYAPSTRLHELQMRNARRSADIVLALLEKQPSGFDDPINFSLSLENALNFNAFTDDELSKVIRALSPFEGHPQEAWVATHFRKDQTLDRGYQGYGFNFNGLYQELACLYAAKGNVRLALQSIDTLLKYNGTYYQNDYTNLLDNVTNVASVFYRAHREDQLDAFVAGYLKHKKMGEIEFYQRVLARAKPYQLTRNMHFNNFWVEAQNLNLQYGEEKEVAFFFKKGREAIAKSADVNERNFLLAVSWKDEGLTTAHHKEVAGKPYDTAIVYSLYRRAQANLNLVNETYLNERMERVGSSTADIIVDQRRNYYLYPDVLSTFNPLGARDYHWNYMSASFVEFLIDQHLFTSLYREPGALKQIEAWLADYHSHVFGGEIFIRNHASPAVLAKLESALSALDARSKIDMNLLYLYLGYYALEQNDSQSALGYYSKLAPENFGNLFRSKLLRRFTNSQSFLLVAKAFTCKLENNEPGGAKEILGAFKKAANRSSLYAFAAREFSEKNANGKLVQDLLDSARAEMQRVENSNSAQPNRYLIAVSLVVNKPSAASLQSARSIIKNQSLKYEALERMARALAYRGELYQATTMIPDNISDEDRLYFVWNILKGYDESQPLAPEWREYNKNVIFLSRTNDIPYVDESE